MTTLEVLLIAWAAGLVLERRGDKLIVKGLKPEAPPQLLAVLKDQKAALMQMLADRQPQTTTRNRT